MKILVFASEPPPSHLACDYNNAMLDELRSRDVELTFDPVPLQGVNADGNILNHVTSGIRANYYDHILAIGIAPMVRPSYTPEVFAQLRQKLKPNGLICQFHDGPVSADAKCDVTFSHKRYGIDPKLIPGKNANIYIGWAARPDVFVSAQSKTDLTIFVDHTHYVKAAFDTQDRTRNILLSLRNFVVNQESDWKQLYNSVTVKRLLNANRMEIVDMTQSDFNVEVHDRKGLPFHQYAKELSTSHIFVPTHPESLGWSLIEAATCGCLVVTDKNFVNVDRMETIVHEVADFDTPRVDWLSVIKKIDVDQCRAKTMEHTWADTVDIILSTLTNWS